MEKVRITRAVAATLRVFLDDPATPVHGYRLMQTTGYPSGKTYPILARLEAAGWLASEAEDVNPSDAGRPPRRMYWLTTEGAGRATREMASLRAELA
jgi:DNA-binding PadR family transcriptional regulator